MLAGIIVLSFFLNFWNLAKEGYSNEYYSAAVSGMLQNPAAFFFGSVDSGLFVTVDKPPLGLWLQALSAKAFGVNAFGLIFSSALAGTLSVLMVFLIVKQMCGPTAGIFASGILATTPILVAMSRTNNLDMLLVFFLLFASFLMLSAAKKQSLPKYILAMVLVGLAFNIKMLEAFFVVPAFILIYLIAAKGRAAKKVIHTAVAICVLLGVSFSWALAVDSIPAGQRPYIGSSQKNSVMDLVFGYNGMARLTGEQGRGGSNQGMDQYLPGSENGGLQFGQDGQPGQNDGQRPEQDNGQFGQNDGRMNAGPGGSQESGQPGFFRLFSSQLSGLISWFLLPALAMVALALFGIFRWIFGRHKRAWTEEQKKKFKFILFWSAWLVPMAVFFSFGGFIHRYYVVLMSPAVAILAASAAHMAWTGIRRKWIVPLLFGATLALQCFIAGSTIWSIYLAPMLVCGAAGLILFLFSCKKREDNGKKPGRPIFLKSAAAVLMACALFIAPIAWSLTPVTQTLNSTIPDAGPDMNKGFGRNMINNGQMSSLEEYIKAHYNGERWALAVSSASQAAPIILDTGLPVMAMGGFSGADQILTLDKLKQYVAAGDLKYYMVTGFSRGGSEINEWLQQNGKQVSLTGGIALYDLSQVKF
ncbi:MAG: glycosyltransferase family 39 protein [Eubacteriales bacterium]